MERLISTLFLYALLALVAYFGVHYAVPRVCEVLEERLVRAAHAGE